MSIVLGCTIEILVKAAVFHLYNSTYTPSHVMTELYTLFSAVFLVSECFSCLNTY